MKKWRVATVAIAAAVVAAVAAGPALAGTTSKAGTAAPTVTGPPQSDPFYTAPAGYAADAPGTILRSRAVHLATLGLLPQKVQAWELLYRTTGYNGQPEATVTTVLTPTGSTPKALVSYQIAEDAVAPQCSPSWELQAGSGTGGAINQLELPLIEGLLGEGLAVSVPDWEGPGGHFGAAREPGYLALDGARAAEAFAPLHLKGAATPLGLWGYSGGSLASGQAAQVQPTYAPELNVKGIALGGFITDFAGSLRQVNGGLGAGLIVSVLNGVARTVPALATALNTYTTPAGKALLAKGASQCETTNVTEYSMTNLDHDFTVPWDTFLSLPTVKAAIQGLNLGSPVPTAPLFVYHAVHDELVPIAGTDATVSRYCAGGDSVTYTRDELSEHLSLMAAGAPAAITWLDQRLSGGATPKGCTTTTVPTMALTGGAAAALPSFLVANAEAILDLPVGTAEF